VAARDSLRALQQQATHAAAQRDLAAAAEKRLSDDNERLSAQRDGQAKLLETLQSMQFVFEQKDTDIRQQLTKEKEDTQKQWIALQKQVADER
jgi:hypothetical protein